MRLLIECLADTASTNITARLRGLTDWTETGEHMDGRPVWAHDDWRLATIEAEHITNEGIEARLPAGLADAEAIVFLSRHRAKSGTPSLTVHPIGNWNDAPYGGRDGQVVPTAPALAGGLLRFLKDHAPDGYEVSMEATHHGPYLTTPTLFLELGSSEAQWDDAAAALVLARAVLEHTPSEAPPVLWVGGGHYCPQLTDLVLQGKVAPGHIIAGWATTGGVSDATLQQAVAGTADCAGFMVQRKATNAEKELASRLAAMGLRELPAE